MDSRTARRQAAEPLRILSVAPSAYDAFVAPFTWIDSPAPPRNEDSARRTNSTLPNAPDELPDAAPAPDAAPRLEHDVLHTSAIAGSPYGVGEIELLVGEAKPLAADARVILLEPTNRIAFPVVRRSLAKPAEGARPDRVDRLVIRFLFRGEESMEVELRVDDQRRAKLRIEVERPHTDHARRLREWWADYRTPQSDPPSGADLVRSWLAAPLASRLRLELPPQRSKAPSRSESGLENLFEKLLSTLLGVDSLLLALPDHQLDANVVTPESPRADRRLPTPFRLAAASYPRGTGAATVEPLAFRVPQECFYVRLGNTANLVWLREFLTGWGGSLREIVVLPTEDAGTRRALERQLAADLDAFRRADVDHSIRDLALIGTDFLFRDGAAVGVLMRDDSTSRLGDIIQQQRRAAAQREGTPLRTQRIGRDTVSFLGSDDHRVRSFYVRRGEYHLISNCRRIAERFIQCCDGRKSLARTSEFQHARRISPLEPSRRAFFYLSDPFFRHIASPAYRIELRRRRRSAAQLQQLSAAHLVSEAELPRARTVEDLILTGYLPDGFGERADGSRPALKNGVACDTERGRRGSFVPIPDMRPNLATVEEVRDYESFRRRYQQQWRIADPLVVSLSSSPGSRTGRQIVDMRVIVAPYARARYAFLHNRLGPAVRSFPASPDNAMLSIDTNLRRSGDSPFQVQFALLDEAPPFRVKNGEVVREGVFREREFSAMNHYAAVRPAETAGLRAVESLMSQLAKGSGATTRAAPRTAAFSPETLPVRLGSHLARFMSSVFSAGQIQRDHDWLVYARRKAVREAALKALPRVDPANASQLRLRVADPARSDVAPYLHAVGYCNAHRESRKVVEMLDELSSTLR